MILHGDSLEVLKTLEANSVDSVVTDPPYGLKFMGKKWDYDVPSKDLWAEVLRVLKPGGHLLSFGGTRTYHRMVVAIEDAGFEIRDQIQWIYGSGFPKSHNVSKAIAKLNGEELVTVSEGRSGSSSRAYQSEEKTTAGKYKITKANNEWNGWGSALKPANEPIVLARKPLEKGLTVAQNVLKYGTGAINVDGCRIEAEDLAELQQNWNRDQSKTMEDDREVYGKFNAIDLRNRAPQGRWPSNCVFDEEAAAVLDEQSGVLKQGIAGNNSRPFGDGKIFGTAKEFKPNNSTTYECEKPSGASRFFYVAKASKRERNAGLEGIANGHPTVKPTKLMTYLCRLITPPGGTVLDPFCGSGSTGVAALKEGFKFIGIEREEQYVEIAKKRVGV